MLPRVLLWELWGFGGVVEPRHKLLWQSQCPGKLQACVCTCSLGTWPMLCLLLDQGCLFLGLNHWRVVAVARRLQVMYCKRKRNINLSVLTHKQNFPKVWILKACTSIIWNKSGTCLPISVSSMFKVFCCCALFSSGAGALWLLGLYPLSAANIQQAVSCLWSLPSLEGHLIKRGC